MAVDVNYIELSVFMVAMLPNENTAITEISTTMIKASSIFFSVIKRHG